MVSALQTVDRSEFDDSIPYHCKLHPYRCGSHPHPDWNDTPGHCLVAYSNSGLVLQFLVSYSSLIQIPAIQSRSDHIRISIPSVVTARLLVFPLDPASLNWHRVCLLHTGVFISVVVLVQSYKALKIHKAGGAASRKTAIVMSCANRCLVVAWELCPSSPMSKPIAHTRLLHCLSAARATNATFLPSSDYTIYIGRRTRFE